MEKAETLLVNPPISNNAQTNKSLNYILYLSGASCYNLHFYDQALSYFLRAYKYYKSWGDFNYYVGMCYLKKSTPENNQAIEYFKKAEILGVKLPQEIVDLMQK